jgi:hypothetical protein
VRLKRIVTRSHRAKLSLFSGKERGSYKDSLALPNCRALTKTGWPCKRRGFWYGKGIWLCSHHRRQVLEQKALPWV